MAHPETDPFDWSVDRVVFEFCQNPRPAWAPSNRPPCASNAAALEQALRENDINGEPLLVAISQEVLKMELGITSLGERYYIMRGIECLRSLSQKYQQLHKERTPNFHRAAPALAAGFISPQITNSNFSIYPVSPYPVHGEPQSGYASPNKHSNPELPPSFETPVNRPQGSVQMTPDQTSAIPTTGIMVLQQPLPQFEGRINHQEETVPSGVIAAAEAGDRRPTDDSTDAGGSTLSAEQPARIAGNADMSVMEPSKHINTSKPTVVDGRRRVAPTFVSHIARSGMPKYLDPSTREDAHSYLGRDGLGPETVIYAGFTSEDDNEEFSYVQQEHSEGQSSYVSTLLKHYYQQPVRQLPDSKARARIPYSGTSLKPGDPHYFTMFVPGLEPAMHNLQSWPALASQTRSRRRGRNSGISLAAPMGVDAFGQNKERPDNTDDYHYLLEKYPPKHEDEDVLALYGDSGDEGIYDQETWDEIDQDRREDELQRNKGAMSQVEVEAVIDEGIKQTIAEWHDRNSARTQLKGYRLWMRASREQRQQAEMNNALYWIHRYNQTIKRMRETIIKDVWFKAAEVKQQCKIFDEAVAQRQEYQYFVTILNSREAPVRPDFEALKRRDRAPRAELPDGEEVLESDSDLGDFILHDDSSDAASIPHDAADFIDTREFLGSDGLAEAPKGVEPSPPPLAEAESIEPSVEQKEEVHVPLVVDSEPEDIQEPADLSDDSEDDIISPSRKAAMSRRVLEAPTGTPTTVVESLLGYDEVDNSGGSSEESDLDALPPLPKSKYRDTGRTVMTPVDLTLSSSPSVATPIAKSEEETSSDYQVQTPELNPIPTPPPKSNLRLNPPKASHTPPAPPSPPRSASKIGQLSLPKLDDIQGIKGLDWELLEERHDYRRILAKLVYCLKRSDAQKIQAHVQKLVEADSNGQHADVRVTEGTFRDHVRNGLLAIAHRTAFVEEISPKKQNMQKIVRQLALLYASYANHTNLMDESSRTQPLLDQAYNDLHLMIKSFFECLTVVLGHFCNSMESKLDERKRKASDDDNEYKDDVDALMLDTDEDHEAGAEIQETAPPSSIKKRKRAVPQSQEALSQQRSDKLRIQEEERRKALADRKLANMGISGDDPAGHIVGFGEPHIFLHEHMGRHVKPHQVKGIQFMWREIIADPKQQGCLLAHTMGLGKTMQVISLLVTIALSGASDDLRIREQVPEHLRQTKTLILCPPSLIDNWHDELTMWRPYPEVLGKLYKIQTQDRVIRLQQINQWAQDGGVLLISYEMFRGMISNDGKKLSEEEHAQVQQDLLDRPTIVVADEAHKMKNAGAKITQVASGFKTTSRIALTGSPLANNLEEYHTMIDWIARGYLGDIVQFRDKYSEPISYGLYEDSTTLERRTSLRKLITLGRDLEPKLNRADISAIEKEMPSKTEFFITLPLTSLQIKAYNIYVQALLTGSGPNGPGNTRLWQWLHVLGLLCNHPLPFVDKLDERRHSLEQNAHPRKKKAMAATDESQGEALPTDVVLADIGLAPDMIEQALAPFRQLDDENRLEDAALSYRSLIVKQIVEASIKTGDKVLIFSHTIPTLNYLEKMLDHIEGCHIRRIDGETKMSTRQVATKAFNKKDSVFNTFLISMKAGGLGLNLQGANRVIIYDFGFNPTWEDQAIGRAYRLGQKKSVYVYRFRAGGTFEDVTYNKAVFKTTLFSRVVDKKNYTSQAKKSLSSYLFNVKDVEQHSLEDSLGRDRDVLDRIVACNTCIRNIELTETFQKEDLEKLSDEEIQLAVEEFEDQRMQRDDPAAYAQKQAAKVAQQIQGLSNNPIVRLPSAALGPCQSNAGMVSMPALNQTVVGGVTPLDSIAGPEASYFDPQQALLFSHRAGAARPLGHHFNQELLSNASATPDLPQQPPRASSAGPERLPHMDGSSDEPDPKTPTATHVSQDSLDQQCRTQ